MNWSLRCFLKIRKKSPSEYLFESYENPQQPLDCDSFSIRIRVEWNVHILATYIHLKKEVMPFWTNTFVAVLDKRVERRRENATWYVRPHMQSTDQVTYGFIFTPWKKLEACRHLKILLIMTFWFIKSWTIIIKSFAPSSDVFISQADAYWRCDAVA